MKLKKTEAYIKRGIKMTKVTQASYWVGGGLFGMGHRVPEVSEHKTVFDMDEAIDLNANHGWTFDDFQVVFANLALWLYRDLKSKK